MVPNPVTVLCTPGRDSELYERIISGLLKRMIEFDVRWQDNGGLAVVGEGEDTNLYTPSYLAKNLTTALDHAETVYEAARRHSE